ncbi:MAG: ADP-ribosylglycohydrolase family protein, partial [Rhodospirillales bacterium]|nr:ADP-ribosylglycohydrolase family protein [Rhodospirillales bacterium]
GLAMLGAIAGDIIGSIYEHRNLKSKDFPLFGPGCTFTDDSVCTVAVADCLMSGGDFADYVRRYVRAHPDRGYGFMFRQWAMWDAGPYNSWGNGSAMRVSPVAHLAGSEAEALELAQRSAAVSHNHPEGVKGAQAVALAIWMAKSGAEPGDISGEISARFDYDLGRSVDDIRPGYEFDVSCAGSVPEAIICALQAADYEDAVRNAVSIGGDSDTIACIAGGIAEALFGVPADIAEATRGYLTDDLTAQLDRFKSAVPGKVR